jgi:hypothetical protein
MLQRFQCAQANQCIDRKTAAARRNIVSACRRFFGSGFVIDIGRAQR